MKNKIGKQDLNRVFWRMQLFNVTNNFQSMQAIGFLSSFAPGEIQRGTSSCDETASRVFQ